MRILTGFLAFLFIILNANNAAAQSFSFSCARDTIINACNVSQCITINTVIPNIRALTSNYEINTTSEEQDGCFPMYVAPNDPNGTSANLTIDDRYSNVISLGFNFPFYGTTYTQLVASTNGLLSFDITNAAAFSHYQILENGGALSATLGNPLNVPSALYDRALIMGPYHDLNPNISTSPDRRIQYQVVGTAPHRRWILSFYKVPLFNCNSLFQNTHQIILYESTGIVEVKVLSKDVCTTWNEARAMIGIQNYERTQGMVVPGRSASDDPWEGLTLNETHRFIPADGETLFKRVELYDLSGTLVAVGDTASIPNGNLAVSFPQVCPPEGITTYVVKSVFKKIDDHTVEIFGTDTIRVNRTNGTDLNAITGTTPSACGPNGTITVDIPDNMGTAPFAYTIDGGTPVNTPDPTHTFTGLLGGSHTVVVTDASGCSSTIEVEVPTSGILNVQTNITNTSCNGASNGSVTLSPQNGVQPYQFSINGGAPVTFSGGATHTISNLASGNYFIKVTDASGCQLDNMLVQIAAGGPLTITTEATPPACAGTASGSITITPTNGTAPYSYSINGGAFGPNNVFSNLATGTYFVSVQDAIGCFVNNTFVTVPVSTGSLNVTATPVSTSCAGVNNGSINLAPANGSAPFQYSINGGTTFQAGTTIPGLAPGNYSVIVKDNSGCTSAPIPVTVDAGNSLLATTATTPTSCNGVSNGTITVTPTNGGGPYTYQIDGGAPQSSNVFNNIGSGDHIIIVTDGSGCVSDAITVSVGVGPAITGTTATVATSCEGALNGSITVNPTTGTSPYTYQLNGGTFQGSNSFTGIAAGNHTVVIMDAAGCTSAPIPVTIASGAPLTATINPVATSCSGATDGGITVTPTNGSTPYEYSLDGTIWQPSNIFNSLAAGSYSVYFRDDAGCISAAMPVTIAAGPGISATVNTTPTSCSGATNGSISITPTTTGTYEYSIDGTTFQPSNIFQNLPTGSYTITFRNDVGCQGTVNTTIEAGQALVATVDVQNVLCNGGNSGTATVTITNNSAAPPYEYSMDGTTWQSSNILNGLVAGSYTVYFRDQNNCNGSQTFNVTEPAPLTITPAEQAALCNGQDNGNIMVAASGGAVPYQYSIDGTNWQASNSFNVVAGNYTVYVKDNNNCMQSAEVSITEPALLDASVVTANASCDGGSDGTITISAVGGTASYQYSLDGINFQSQNIFNVIPGNYNVIIRDANGCSINRNAIVDLTNNLYVIPVNDTIVCEGVGVQLQPNTNATAFAWKPLPGLSATNVREPIATPSVTTDYIVEASLGLCKVNDTIRVNVLPAPIPNAGLDGDICYGQSFQLQASGGVEYSWTPSTYMNTSALPDPVVTPEQTIQYSLEVTDANGCRSLQPDMVTVNVTPPIQIQINNDTVVAMGDVLQLFANSVATDYSWSPAYGLDDPNKSTPIATITGDITYKVIATTSAGCKGEASVSLKVFEGPEVYVPTAFTPNGDGLNDVFKPFPVGIKSYTYFRVYNRWGQLIFATSDFNKGWDGTISGKAQPTGVYVWIVEGLTKDDKKITKRGTITLVR